MTASQFIRRLASGYPISGEDGVRPPDRGPCFAYNRGKMCDKASCRFAHKGYVCGGNSHRAIRCFKAQARRLQGANPPTPSSQGRSDLQVDHPLHKVDHQPPSTVSGAPCFCQWRPVLVPEITPVSPQSCAC